MAPEFKEFEIVGPESEACKRIKGLLGRLFLLGLISLPAIGGYYVGRSHSTPQQPVKTDSVSTPQQPVKTDPIRNNQVSRRNHASNLVSLYQGEYTGTYSSKQGKGRSFGIKIERDGSVTAAGQGARLANSVLMRCTGHIVPSANRIAFTCFADHSFRGSAHTQIFDGKLRRQNNQIIVAEGNFQASDGNSGTWNVKTKVSK
ncbi:MAG: hypothetical protein KME43_25860 [Myxacorys chilensis ATA2-1-KO14]|jgi:hypothetical protein|nr:hypothetical protein [Myxacorys chilensis ATA2-1-KO14]